MGLGWNADEKTKQGVSVEGKHVSLKNKFTPK